MKKFFVLISFLFINNSDSCMEQQQQKNQNGMDYTKKTYASLNEKETFLITKILDFLTNKTEVINFIQINNTESHVIDLLYKLLCNQKSIEQDLHYFLYIFLLYKKKFFIKSNEIQKIKQYAINNSKLNNFTNFDINLLFDVLIFHKDFLNSVKIFNALNNLENSQFLTFFYEKLEPIKYKFKQIEDTEESKISLNYALLNIATDFYKFKSFENNQNFKDLLNSEFSKLSNNFDIALKKALINNAIKKQLFKIKFFRTKDIAPEILNLI